MLRHLLYPVRAFRAKHATICLPDLKAAAEKKNIPTMMNRNSFGKHTERNVQEVLLSVVTIPR